MALNTRHTPTPLRVCRVCPSWVFRGAARQKNDPVVSRHNVKNFCISWRSCILGHDKKRDIDATSDKLVVANETDPFVASQKNIGNIAKQFADSDTGNGDFDAHDGRFTKRILM